MKETIEEAAERWNEKQTTLEFGKPHNAPNRIKSFIEGAKWQMDRMYSEEDMAEAFIACWKANVPDGIECKVSFNEWFEKFKNK